MQPTLQIPIFANTWWLEAVKRPSDEIGVIELQSSGRTAARLPYVLAKRRGLRIIEMPPLTPVLGPQFFLNDGKTATRLGQEKDLTEELIKRLPAHDQFSQAFHPSITNWLPWHWNSFSQTTLYTYRLTGAASPEAQWDALEPKIRTDIRKAKNRYQLKIERDLPLSTFIDLNHATFIRQNRKPPHSAELIERIEVTCRRHNSHEILYAVDSSGKAHAAAFFVWDDTTTYYLMSGMDPKYRGSGAVSLILWEAIQLATKRSHVFDFEGSMVESIERFFRGFGATSTPYFQVTRISNRHLRRLRLLRSIFE